MTYKAWYTLKTMSEPHQTTIADAVRTDPPSPSSVLPVFAQVDSNSDTKGPHSDVLSRRNNNKKKANVTFAPPPFNIRGVSLICGVPASSKPECNELYADT